MEFWWFELVRRSYEDHPWMEPSVALVLLFVLGVCWFGLSRRPSEAVG
jgi:hypothetical protein